MKKWEGSSVELSLTLQNSYFTSAYRELHRHLMKGLKCHILFLAFIFTVFIGYPKTTLLSYSIFYFYPIKSNHFFTSYTTSSRRNKWPWRSFTWDVMSWSLSNRIRSCLNIIWSGMNHPGGWSESWSSRERQPEAHYLICFPKKKCYFLVFMHSILLTS